MRKDYIIPEISAEMLLNYLYPEDGSRWIAKNEGTFFRNYNSDVLAVDEERIEVETTRDSFLSLLPQGLLSLESDLKGEDAAEQFKKMQLRIRLLREAFKPIDTFKFRDSLFIERQVDSLLQGKLAYLLSTYFGIDLNAIQNRYVREAAILLPYVSRRRGDFSFIASLLRTLLKCEVSITKDRYSDTDSTRRWLPRVRYDLLIPGLTPEEYRERDSSLDPLREFLSEWLIPFEVWCEIRIKGIPRQAGTRPTLDYNMEVKR